MSWQGSDEATAETACQGPGIGDGLLAKASCGVASLRTQMLTRDHYLEFLTQ